jgi:hypothetical protein
MPDEAKLNENEERRKDDGTTKLNDEAPYTLDAAEQLKGCMRLAHPLLTRCFFVSHSFFCMRDTLCTFSVRDFVDHCRFFQR